MKKLFVLLVSISLGISLFAVPSSKNELVVRTTSGDSTFLLSQQPEISFTETSVVIANADSTITIPKTEFVQFLFTPSNKCLVTFVDWDGTILQSSVVNIGDMPEYRGEIPTKESDSSRCVFTGWTPELRPVTEDMIYTAQYTEMYEVSYYNWDGTLLQSFGVKYGEMPAYYGETPTRDSDAQYTYTFIGWSPEVDIVTGAASYYAQFSKTINRYEVFFYNYDGTLLQSGWYNYGALPEYYGSEPTREHNAQYTYTFSGWSPMVDTVTGTANYYAQFSETLNQYVVEFYNWDGTYLCGDWYDYGEWPTYRCYIPERDPEFVDDIPYQYNFIGWSPEQRPVTEDIVYTAQFEQSLYEFEVNFYNWDGMLLQSSGVKYGEMPAYYGETPTREPDVQYTYTFSGWSPSVDYVTGSASYYAQYESTLNQYEVTFVDWDATVLKQDLVDYGTSAIAPDDPVRGGYDFVGWDTDYSYIVSDLTVTAQYEKQKDTSIDAIELEIQSPKKVFENNILYIILPDGTRYNAQGAAL